MVDEIFCIRKLAGPIDPSFPAVTPVLRPFLSRTVFCGLGGLHF